MGNVNHLFIKYMPAENNLLEQIKKSDQKAFEIIFRLYYQPLSKFAQRIIDDEEVSADIVQEVFIQFWEQRQSISNTNIKSYLYTVVKNKALNHIRHLQVKLKHTNEVLHSIDEAYEYETGNEELNLKIVSSIDKLPEQCKKIFIMSRMHGLKQNEIAEELNISIKTVKNQIGKALKILRAELKGLSITIIISILNLF